MDNKSLKIKDDVTPEFYDIEMAIDDTTVEQYTDEHFMNKMNSTLEPYSSSPKILNNEILNNEILNNLMSINRNTDIRASNSPMTLSKSGSESSFETSEETDRTENTLNETKQRLTLLKSSTKPHKKHKRHFRNLSFKEVEHSLDTFDSSYKLSNEFDIIITYLNGQKNLYISAKNFTSCKLNILMVPTLIISTVVTVLSPFIRLYGWSNITIAILNATITLLISLVNYFKLESSTQIYAHIASQYDKLQTVLELANSRLTFLDNELEQNELVIKTIQEFEIKIFEIKDSTTIFIPEDVKSIFPIISHINIFSFIKRIETYKKSLIYKYRDAKNEMRYILYKIDPETSDERCKLRMAYLIDIKNKIRDELIEYKTIYSYMDDAFIQEIKNAEEQKFWCIRRMCGYKSNATQPDIIKKHIPKL